MLFSKVVCTLNESKEFFSIGRNSISRSVTEFSKHFAMQLHFTLYAIKNCFKWREVQLMHDRVQPYIISSIHYIISNILY